MYAAFATPLISFLIVRKSEKTIALKIFNAVIITVVFAGLCVLIGMWFFLKSGKVS